MMKMKAFLMNFKQLALQPREKNKELLKRPKTLASIIPHMKLVNLK